MKRQIARIFCVVAILVFAAAQPISTHAGQNPFDLVKEAAKKAKEELKRRAQEAAQNAAGQVPTPNQAPAPNQQAPAATQPSSQGAGGHTPKQSGNAPVAAGSAGSSDSLSAADLLGPPPSTSSTPPENTGTAERSAKLAAATGKYDIAGLRLGMPLKAATTAVKAHNATMKMQQQTVGYVELGGNMLYGLAFTNPNERISLELTMPPNPIVVSRITRVLKFTRASAPTQQVLVADLTKKYGPPSHDDGADGSYANGADRLNITGKRKLLWIDNLNGQRLAAAGIQPTCGQAAGQFAVSAGQFGIQFDAAAPGQDAGIRTKLEAIYSQRGLLPCYDHRFIEVWIERCCQNENVLAAPDLVGGLSVTLWDPPLEINAIGATHDMLVEAVRRRDQKEQDDAQKNRPKL